jgi:prolyl-tRNA editing enzyme YbaK/EbsC (Cys-tRNA(Pro) deacylase)
MRFQVVYAAAGTSNTVFGINPKELKELTSGEFAEVFQH